MKIFISTISFQNSNIRRLLKVNRNNKINQCYLLSSILRIGSCLGLQVKIKKAHQILINYAFFWLVKYYLYNSNYYSNIIFESYVILRTKFSAKNL